ncbi:FAD-dependent oxidoreductase [Sphingobium chungbukense]|uniref:Monooxygenase n=1 Tax=Sphingobium chungbukense TaxID=56193 RepID=A0A0M3AGZ8_9SPHN|nr:FAD-dependent oxidoreductase [Sphingobium chungbukense]KKW89308.1 monooxygenase [Sphingobium chungbukense]
MAADAQTVQTSVLIVGAGPVGMTLALDLASRGVEVAVVEKRAEHAPPRQRCNHISARTLEIFRRLGVAAEIRDAGLPANYPQDVAYVTTLTGHELTRIRIPARADRFGSVGYADSDWPTPEPPHRCNQMYFEPILQRHIQASPRIRIFYDHEVIETTQDDSGVIVRARIAGSDKELLFRAEYLVGCDGGVSTIRKAIGASFEGASVISGTRSVLVRAPALLGMLHNKPAWMTWFVNPGGFGCVVAMNGTDLWAFHIWLPSRAPDFDSVDPEIAIRAAVGGDLEYDIISIDDWYGRRLIASRFRDSRIFIAGDAAHIWIPFAGYGMNAGIADAMNLSWQLAGVINGWGDPGLLRAYEVERHPVTDQVSRVVMAIALSNLDTDLVKNPPATLIEDGPAGDRIRAEAGRYLYDANVGQFACLGLNFGTYYEESPVIAYDGEAAPAYDLLIYHPSTVPGCRTPHLWLDGGVSLYDRMGSEFTLLRFDPTVDVTGLSQAAAQRGVPLTILDLSSGGGGDIYRCKLVLSRPDQHIAWRGDSEPENPLELIDLVRGAPPETSILYEASV